MSRGRAPRCLRCLLPLKAVNILSTTKSGPMYIPDGRGMNQDDSCCHVQVRRCLLSMTASKFVFFFFFFLTMPYHQVPKGESTSVSFVMDCATVNWERIPPLRCGLGP